MILPFKSAPLSILAIHRIFTKNYLIYQPFSPIGSLAMKRNFKSLNAALSHIGTQQDTELLSIIHGCKEGKRSSQEKLYKMMYPKMMSMVKRYTNPYQYHLAEEILNNGFLKVFQKVDSYKFEGSFEGWVRRVIYHSIFDYVRQNMKYNEKVVFVEKDEIVNGDLASNLGYEELMGLVQSLSDSTRAVFNMFVIDGMSHKEISETLEISEGTSKWHLFEARRILKTKVEKLYKIT